MTDDRGVKPRPPRRETQYKAPAGGCKVFFCPRGSLLWFFPGCGRQSSPRKALLRHGSALRRSSKRSLQVTHEHFPAVAPPGRPLARLSEAEQGRVTGKFPLARRRRALRSSAEVGSQSRSRENLASRDTREVVAASRDPLAKKNEASCCFLLTQRAVFDK